MTSFMCDPRDMCEGFIETVGMDNYCYNSSTSGYEIS